MTPGQTFLLILFLLYLSDCFLLVPRRGFALLSITGRFGRWRLASASEALGNSRAGLVLTTPLPPLGRALVAGFWPISLGEEGVSNAAVSCPNPGLRPSQGSRFVRWEAVKETSWEGRKLLVNGKLFQLMSSPETARQYARLIHDLARRPVAERGGEIARWCRRELSAKRVRRRWQVFERATKGLRYYCNLLFVMAFFVVPFSYWYFGAKSPFIAVLLLGFALVAMIGIEFWCLHRRFFPEQRAERFQLWMLVGFMPQYSMRAIDELSKSFLGNAHPLAAAEVFLDDERFRQFRDTVLRDIIAPEPFTQLSDSQSDAQRLAEVFRNVHERPAIEAVADRRLKALPQLVPDEESVDGAATGYCPRCLMTYSAVAEECIDCGGVAVSPL